MTGNAYPLLDQNDLRPGDVGLMLGEGEISKLIAWIGDTIYSHAFLIYDQNQLAEAALSGLRLYSIKDRIADTKEALFLDIYRPSDHLGKAFSEAQVAAMRSKTQSYLGFPYAKSKLAQIGIMSAMRNKIPDSEPVRLLIRMALNHLIKDEPSHMVCSEFVFRILQEAEVEPRGAISPTVILSPSSHTGLPKVNVKALWQELKQLLKPSPSAAEAATSVAETPLATTEADDSSTAEHAPAPMAEISNSDLLAALPPGAVAAYESGPPRPDELLALMAAVRAKHALGVAEAPVLIVPNPNPKTILPLDLASSPSLRFIGRLARPISEDVAKKQKHGLLKWL